METTQQLRTIGEKPVGTADGSERWVTITRDDTDVVIRGYVGWAETASARLTGHYATVMQDDVAEQMYAEIQEG